MSTLLNGPKSWHFVVHIWNEIHSPRNKKGDPIYEWYDGFRTLEDAVEWAECLMLEEGDHYSISKERDFLECEWRRRQLGLEVGGLRDVSH